MKIIGAVGRIGSGKDEFVAYLQRHAGARVFSLGDMVREAAAAEGLEPTRDHLQSVAARYATEKGEDYFIRRLADRLEREEPATAAITGIRKPVDAQVVRERYRAAFLLVHVAAEFDLRFVRNRQRGEARDPRGIEEFRQQNRREEELFGLSETIAMADLTIDNNGSLEDFHLRIEERICPWLS